MSKVASPMTLKRKEMRMADNKKMEEEVQKWIKSNLGKDVKVPEDLESGVIICETLNKITPKTIEKFENEPKNIFAKAENFKKINEALIKFGIYPSDLPEPNAAANGKANERIISLLYKLSTRASKLRPAPESVIETRKKISEKEKKRGELLKKIHAQKKRERVLGAIRAAKYQKQYKNIREGRLKKHLKANKKGNFYVPPEPKLAFVMRIRGINGVPPKPKKILQLFRLRQINNACFVRLNKATLNMLKVIEPYITYGYPSVRSVRALLLKRGYLKIHGQRIPITSNALIAKHLRKYTVRTMDDLVHEIVTVGKYFAKVNRKLWPFKMNSPRGGFGKGKLKHFVEGGAAGNRMGMINRFIRKCL